MDGLVSFLPFILSPLPPFFSSLSLVPLLFLLPYPSFFLLFFIFVALCDASGHPLYSPFYNNGTCHVKRHTGYRDSSVPAILGCSFMHISASFVRTDIFLGNCSIEVLQELWFLYLLGVALK